MEPSIFLVVMVMVLEAVSLGRQRLERAKIRRAKAMIVEILASRPR